MQKMVCLRNILHVALSIWPAPFFHFSAVRSLVFDTSPSLPAVILTPLTRLQVPREPAVLPGGGGRASQARVCAAALLDRGTFSSLAVCRSPYDSKELSTAQIE